jgi:hypothetical protein
MTFKMQPSEINELTLEEFAEWIEGSEEFNNKGQVNNGLDF